MPLTEEDKRRLREVFKDILATDLGSVPAEAMTDFEEEMETLQTLSFTEALEQVMRLADIIKRERGIRERGLVPMPEPTPTEVVKDLKAPHGLESPLESPFVLIRNI